MKKMLIISVLFSAACSSVKITGIDKTEDFTISKYKSFNFYEVSGTGDALSPDYQTNLKLIKEGIVKQMTLKGLTLTADNPDLLVNIGVIVSERTQTRETSFTNPTDRMAYMGQRNYSWNAEEVEVGKYKEGTMSLHLVERTTNKLVWQGVAESVVPEKQKNVPALIDDGLTKLFEKIQ